MERPRSTFARILQCIALIAISAASARDARAADVRVERSGAAASCPDEASFAARLGADASSARSVKVRFERTPKGYRSTVVTSEGKQRTLSDDAVNCDGLAEGTLLAVRLALDSAGPPADRAAAAPEATPTPAASPSPEAPVAEAPTLSTSAAPPRDGVAPPPDDARRAGIGAEVLAAVVASVGIGSPLAPGFRGGAALTLAGGHLSLGITGVVLGSQTREVGNGEVDVDVAGGGIEGCGRTHLTPPILVALCARAEAFRLAGTSRGFARTEEQARPLFAGTVLGRSQARLAGRLAIFVEVGAVVPLVRERFAIDRVGIVYDPPAVGGSGGIGAIADFE